MIDYTLVPMLVILIRDILMSRSPQPIINRCHTVTHPKLGSRVEGREQISLIKSPLELIVVIKPYSKNIVA